MYELLEIFLHFHHKIKLHSYHLMILCFKFTVIGIGVHNGSIKELNIVKWTDRHLDSFNSGLPVNTRFR